MEETRQKLVAFIKRIPLVEGKRQELLNRLNNPQGEAEVRKELKVIVDLAVLELQKRVEIRRHAFEEAQKALDEAESGFNQDMSKLEAEAKELAIAISKAQDEQALEEARKKISE